MRNDPGVRWSYSTGLTGLLPPAASPGTSEFFPCGKTFDDLEKAVAAAARWLQTAADHGHLVAVRLDKVEAG